MSYKKIGIIAVCVIVIAMGMLSYFREDLLPNVHRAGDTTDLSGNYLATEEIAEAEKKLAAGIQPADVITTLQDNSPRVAIIFDGLPDEVTTDRIVDVLQKYQAQAVFFVEGENAIDQPGSIQKILKGGQKIGNFTFIGAPAMEQLPPSDQLAQICRTQAAVEGLTDTKPTLFRAHRTIFNDTLLKSVRASGIDYAVKESVWYNRNVIHNQAQADAYAASIRPGSILAIRVGVPVERKASEKGKSNEKPAFDKKATIPLNGENKKAAPTEDLANEVERLLVAFQKRGVKVVFVDQFRKIRFVSPAAAPARQPAAPAKPAVPAKQQAQGRK